MNRFVLITVDAESIPLKNGKKDYSSITEGIPLLLDLFKEFGVSSTFFLTSDVVENTAREIGEIIKRGHEIACHGAEHKLLDLHNRVQQFENIKRATESIRENLHISPMGFRAPVNVVNEKTLSVLAQLGYKYDSSVVPASRILKRCYFPRAPRTPYCPSPSDISERGDSPVVEIPISVLPMVKLPLVFSYMILFGLGFFKLLLSNADEEIMTCVIHTYELFPLPEQVDASIGAKLLYRKAQGKGCAMLRELLEFLEAKFSPTYICAKTVLSFELNSKEHPALGNGVQSQSSVGTVKEAYS